MIEKKKIRRKKTPQNPVDEVFEQKARENRTDLSKKQLERFVAEGNGLRRNLALRKKQMEMKRQKTCTHSK